MRLARQDELDHALTIKLNRAKAHLDKLREAIDAWREGDRYAFDTEREREGHDSWLLRWNVRQVEAFPPEWTLWAGEFLYQVHSSLDQLAWELANSKAFPNEPDRVTFPIYANRSRFWRRDKSGNLRRGSGGWVLQRIFGPMRVPILSAQPYKRGYDAQRHPLWHLHCLSNEAKHKALHVASSALKHQRFQGLNFQDLERVGAGIGSNEPFDDRERAERVFWMRLRETGPRPEIKGQAEFLIEPVFGYGSPAGLVGAPFFETLRGIYNYVVEDFVKRHYNPMFP